MKYRFYQPLSPDQSGHGPYIYRYDVVEQEVCAVLSRPAEDLPAFGGARMALGQISPGERYLQVVYVPEPERGCAFVLVGFTLRGEALAACRKRQRGRGVHQRLAAHAPHASDWEVVEGNMPVAAQFPSGWDEERVHYVIMHYEQQDPAAQVAEVEAAFPVCG